MIPPPPYTAPLLDPRGLVSREWYNWFLKFASVTPGGGVAPPDAAYVVSALDAGLPDADVLTASTTNTISTAVAGTVQVQRAALTGDVTASANANATTIANDAVTFAKMQEIATDRLIGRDTAATGNPEEISVTGGIEFTGSASIRTTAFTGDVTKTAGGTALTIANDAVTFAKMQNLTTDRLMGRDTAGTGDPEQLTVSGGIEFTGSTGIQTSAFTGDVTKTAGGTALTIANDAVTDAKLRESAAVSVIGRSANTTGNPADIAAGANGTFFQRSADALSFITYAAAGLTLAASIKIAIIAGGAAGDHTVTGIAVGDQLVAVVRYIGAGVAVTDVSNITAEFTITGTNTINNTGGTNTTGDKLAVWWVDLT